MNKPESKNVPHESNKPRSIWGWLKLAWDVAWDWKKIKEHIEAEIHHTKKFPLLIICALVFAGIGGCLGKAYFANKELNTVRNNYQNTNSFLSGQLDSTGKELQTTKTESEQKTTDYANIVAQLKADHNEQMRSKDTEILKLTDERDSALMRERQLESLPETAFLVYSNANLLNRFAENVPDFIPEINGRSLTNCPQYGAFRIVTLNSNREISINIPTLEPDAKPIEHFTMDLLLPFDVTNISTGIADGYWKTVPGRLDTPSGGTGTSIEIVSQATMTSHRYFTATPITLSTNYKANVFVSRLDIFAPSMNGVESLNLIFLLQQ